VIRVRPSATVPPSRGVPREARPLLRLSLAAGLLLAGADARGADRPDLWGRWTRNPGLSQDAVSKVFASLAPVAQRFSPDDRRFHDALLRFAKVIDTLQVEQTRDDIKIILGGDEVQIYYPGRSHVRQGVLGGRLKVLASWRGDELVVQERNDFGTLVQGLSLDAERRLTVLLTLDDRRLTEPLQLLSVYDRVRADP
jgi:hypothetical protein